MGMAILQRTRAPKKARMRAAIYDIRSVKAEMCRRNLYYFIQEFWSEVSNEQFRPNWHIEYLCKELKIIAKRVAQGLPKEYDLIVNVPPGTTKTITLSIMFPVWCWTQWYDMRFISASYSAALSLESAEYSRDLVRSDKFHAYFPGLTIKRDKDTKSNFRVQKLLIEPGGKETIKLGGNRYSTSVGGTLTGFHAHILLVDDPLDPNRAASEVELKKANRWIDQTLSTRKVDKAITPTILIMQRLDEDDPTGHLLAKKKKNTKHICLPGEIIDYESSLKPKEAKQYYIDGLLDPVRMPLSVLKELEADLGQYGYAGQIGQAPTPPAGGMFQVDNYVTVDTLPTDVNFTKTVRYWDKAGTQNGGAYTVGCKMSSLRSGKFIIHDVKRGQWATHVREAIIKATADADVMERPTSIYIEQEPGSGGKESAEATITRLAGHSVYKDPPVGNKVFRADPYSVQVNNGNVLLLRGEWIREFIEEHRHFPFSKYQDQVDAGSGCFSKLAQKKRAGPLFRSGSRRCH